MPSHKIILSGGGTGGHIFPAIAIADALREMDPEIEVLFVGAQGRMEMEKVPASGYKIEGLWISGFQRTLSLKNLLFPFKVIQSLMDAKSIVKKFKPNAVIGTGGYASGPVLWVSSRMGIPSLIQEQNSYAGITNKILGKKVNKVCVAFDGMESFFPKNKIVVTGNPVREEIVKIEGKKEEALKFFDLEPNKKTILIVGGSLGAKAINDSMMPHIKDIVNENIQMVWQTGKVSYEGISNAANPFADQGIKVHQFITRMDLAYAAADVVISRAGAIAVSEICLTNKPCILVPLPTAAEDHQTKNAEALARHDAAIIVKNSEAPLKLFGAVTELIKNDSELEKLRQNIKPLSKPDSARTIAKEVLKMINT
ncbi:MAG: undecaprenyldiphospho-muramoylpentapeptide beta-N-acetylglucosaminyltransferase [Crocinitomicaceae bacterium]|nr:undecaprenyldiphospho-muramoylpentapeptide beta-N-acetylglucosaminyltransferase [Crocinitomicaceae bacterium]|tara:strand:+ start:1568 stop:2671 length:1104 start_codon:yes stop_codon:yes gene_type:complete